MSDCKHENIGPRPNGDAECLDCNSHLYPPRKFEPLKAPQEPLQKEVEQVIRAAQRLLDNVADDDNGPPSWCADECFKLEAALAAYHRAKRSSQTPSQSEPETKEVEPEPCPHKWQPYDSKGRYEECYWCAAFRKAQKSPPVDWQRVEDKLPPSPIEQLSAQESQQCEHEWVSYRQEWMCKHCWIFKDAL